MALPYYLFTAHAGSTMVPNDGRILDEGSDVPFFSTFIHKPPLFDILAFAVIGGITAVFYSSYVSGNFGVMKQREFVQQLHILSAQESFVDRQIQHQVNLNHRISDSFLDLDLLEEQSRRLLGYQHSDDILISE